MTHLLTCHHPEKSIRELVFTCHSIPASQLTFRFLKLWYLGLNVQTKTSHSCARTYHTHTRIVRPLWWQLFTSKTASFYHKVWWELWMWLRKLPVMWQVMRTNGLYHKGERLRGRLFTTRWLRWSVLMNPVRRNLIETKTPVCRGWQTQFCHQTKSRSIPSRERHHSSRHSKFDSLLQDRC